MTITEDAQNEEGRIKFVQMDMHPESPVWLEIVEGNLDFISTNFNRDRRKLKKALSKIPYGEDNAKRCDLLRNFVRQYHNILDGDVEMLVHWAIRNEGATRPGDLEFAKARNDFHETVRGIKNDHNISYENDLF
jgi:hypothetical protein